MIDNKTLISHFSFDQPFVNRSFSLLRKHRGSRYKASLDDRSNCLCDFFRLLYYVFTYLNLLLQHLIRFLCLHTIDCMDVTSDHKENNRLGRT